MLTGPGGCCSGKALGAVCGRRQAVGGVDRLWGPCGRWQAVGCVHTHRPWGPSGGGSVGAEFRTNWQRPVTSIPFYLQAVSGHFPAQGLCRVGRVFVGSGGSV